LPSVLILLRTREATASERCKSSGPRRHVT
jgi:hypothetical protein